MFVTLEQHCPQCDPRPQSLELDDDYSTPDAAYECFKDIASAESSKILLEHAKEYYEGVIETQRVVRDKAKLLLGATSFTIAIFGVALAILKDSFGHTSFWLHLVILAPLVVIATHFVRGLVWALITITREMTVAVSTQDVLKFLPISKSTGDAEAESQKRLAALYRSAATLTNRHLTERKSALMLAQGCFKWGLILLPFVLFGYLLMIPFVPRGSTAISENAGADGKDGESKVRMAELELRYLQRQVQLIGRLDELRSQLRAAEEHEEAFRQLTATIQKVERDLAETGTRIDRLSSEQQNSEGFPSERKEQE